MDTASSDSGKKLYYLYLRPQSAGDIVGILDSTGALVVEYKYDAWGKLLSTTGSLTDTLGARNPFRYRGYVYDEESELYYLRSRYFTPVVGRFVNADTKMGWTSLMGKNMYLYCMNAPSLLSDSNGFSPVIEPRPSRPENWDADYRAEFRRERMQALVRKAAKAVMQAVRNVNLYRMVLQLANHGGGVIKFKSGSKATCYTSAYWYKKNRPEADWGSVGLDALFIGVGNLASRVSFFAKCSPYIEGITDALVFIHACNNLQIKQINRCIDSSGSIGWISWERSLNCAPIPTAWDSTTFTPAEWFGEIEYVEFFE